MTNILQDNTKWIWVNTDYSSGKFTIVYFRRDFFVDDVNAQLKLIVSAESGYRLYINGQPISIGPCKGDERRKYYDNIDVSKFLRKGKNVLAAKVLHLPCVQDYDTGIHGPTSYFRWVSGGFLLDGALTNRHGELTENISTNKSWKVFHEKNISPVRAEQGIWATSYEYIGANAIHNWYSLGLDDSSWNFASEVTDSYLTPNTMSEYGQSNGWDLVERPIPAKYEIQRRFASVVKSNLEADKVESVIKHNWPLCIPANTQCYIELDAGEITTAYFSLNTNGGLGSRVKVLYSECYEQDDNGCYSKGKRDDISGMLRGDYDIFEPVADTCIFEPFFFRTFRYIRMEITGLCGKYLTEAQVLHVRS